MRKNLPIGIQNFEEIILNDYLYVDKTEQVYQLIKTGKVYFLSRPRRFGKSLLLSTFEAFFQGKRELFKGLAIEHLEKNWIEYPILHLDLNAENYDSIEALESRLNRFLSAQEDLFGRQEADVTFSQRFQSIIQNIASSTGRKVVVLVDEYDKPLLSTVGDEELHTRMKNILKGFYGVFKSEDANLCFIFLAGVTKFGQVSVFSDLNQPYDLSTKTEFSALCGLTQHEMETVLLPYIEDFADRNELTSQEASVKLKQMYDGYHFANDLTDVYNPFSVLNALRAQTAERYWFQTGTPTFLVEVMKKSHIDITTLEDGEYRISEFSDYKADVTRPIPLLYQSGYLTIKGYDKTYDSYILGFPNDEVRYGLFEFLIPYYASTSEGIKPILDFTRSLKSGDVDRFISILKVFLSGIPYDMISEKENYFHTVVYLIFKLMGQFIESEVKSSHGRADAVVKTTDYIYVFEFKLDKPVQEALDQIESKEYALPYSSDNRRCIKVGVSFSSKKRNVEDFRAIFT